MVNQRIGLLIGMIMVTAGLNCSEQRQQAWAIENPKGMPILFSHRVVEVTSGMTSVQYDHKLLLAGINYSSHLDSKKFLVNSRDQDHEAFRAFKKASGCWTELDETVDRAEVRATKNSFVKRARRFLFGMPETFEHATWH